MGGRGGGLDPRDCLVSEISYFSTTVCVGRIPQGPFLTPCMCIFILTLFNGDSRNKKGRDGGSTRRGTSFPPVVVTFWATTIAASGGVVWGSKKVGLKSAAPNS